MNPKLKSLLVMCAICVIIAIFGSIKWAIGLLIGYVLLVGLARLLGDVMKRKSHGGM